MNEIEIKSICNGWMTLQFKKYTVYISYLTDIAKLWLTEIDFALDNNTPISLSFTDEEHDYILVVTCGYIFLYSSDELFYKIDMEYEHFIVNFFNQLQKFKQELIDWPYWVQGNMSEKQRSVYMIREIEINKLFNKINAKILLKDLRKD